MDVKTKKNVYLSLWVILGILLAVLFTAFCDFLIVRGVSQDPAAYMQYWSLAWVIELIIFCFWGIVFVGLAAWAGPIAYKKIYIEGARGSKYLVDVTKTVKKSGDEWIKTIENLDIDVVMKWTITVFLIYLMIIITAVLVTVFAFGIKTGVELKTLNTDSNTTVQTD